MGIYIEKKYQKTPLGAVVEDSMTSGSTVNAPSINAVQSAFSNPNLLINGGFQVWQRGTSFIEQIGTSSQVFCADRWSTFGGIVAEKTENGIKVTGGEELLALNQRLEFKLKSDTTYTLSAKVNGVVYTKTFNGGNYFDESLFVYISWGDEFDAIGIYIPTNTTYEIEWVKLEQGSIATPFVPRLYAEELALCQRYYQVHANIWLNRLTNALTKFYLPVKMRVAPTFTGTFKQYSMAGTLWETIASSDIMTQMNQIVVWASGTSEWYVSSEIITLDAEIY